jgi:YesN/AraC family two-component response regulator
MKMISKEIGLIFLDIVLPDINGLELLKQIKNEYPSIPVVIITSYSTEDACIDAFRIGARDYIKKPFSSEEILQKAKLLMSAVSTQSRKPFLLSTENKVDDRYRLDIPTHILNGIIKVKNYIDKNYMTPLDLLEASKMAGMNRTYFSKYFKLLTGYTFKDYIDNLRLKKARDLLKNKDLNISEIAEYLGYTPKSFSDAFKRIFGITPKDLKD